MKAPTNLAGYDPRTSAGDCRWDGRAADRAVGFFPKFCKHHKGSLAGQPYELNPWERDFVATLFGWMRPNGKRRYREAFVAIPRKNSKTTLCAGLGLYCLLADGEAGAEVYCAASTRDQAARVYEPAAMNCRKSDALTRRTKIVDTRNRITVHETDSFMVAVAAEAGPLHGTNSHAVIIDEVHTQPSRDLYDVFSTSMVAREQPLMIGITTAGHDKDSLCYELWTYARQIRDGEADDPYFLPVIYEASEKDDWRDPETWKKANPNYERSVPHEYLATLVKKARVLPANENVFKNLHLNIWTEAESRWIASDDWNACEGEYPDLENCQAWCGVDLASTDDITAVVWVVRHEDTLYIDPHFFVPEATIAAARKKFQSQYREWRDRGLLTVTDGSATDYEVVRQQIYADALYCDVQMIGFDGWQALDTYQQLDAQGLPCVKIPQTFAGLWPGVKAVEENVLNHTLAHDGNPVLSWMLACTVVDIDANGNRKPNKRKSHGDGGTKGKIDGVSALVMAMVAEQTTDSTEPAIYF